MTLDDALAALEARSDAGRAAGAAAYHKAARRYLGVPNPVLNDLTKSWRQALSLPERLALAEARYEQGADDYLAVLDARRELLSAEQELVSVRLQKLANRITLYRALGGGVFPDRAIQLSGRNP